MTHHFCRKLQELGLMVKVLLKTRKKHTPTNILTPFSTLTYRKLPDHNLKLSVLKLDGSSFSFQVARNATVAMLKSAIEEEFSLFPMEERDKLWSLVWSNFCLSFEGQKLIRDAALIRKYGIKDGDQLHFIQHLRIDRAPTPQQCKDLNNESKQCSVTKAAGARANHHDVSCEDEDEDVQLIKYSNGEDSAIRERRSRLTHSLMGCCHVCT